MKLDDIITGVISGTFGGLIVWGLQQWYLNRKENKKFDEDKIVKPKHLERVITDSIISDLRPGTNIELMRELLGTPTKQSNSDWLIFKEEEKKTNSYLYILKNAYVKITSEDNKTIDTFTLFPHDNSFKIDEFVFPCNTNGKALNEIKVCKDLIERATNHTFIHTRIDASFALEIYIPNPLYQNYTYFGYGPDNSFEYNKSKDPNLFIGGTVTGVCISNSEENAFFIYHMETK